MSFLDSFKKGVSEMGSKAKVAVEINRLNLQVSQKEKEIQTLFGRIGKLVYSLVIKSEELRINEQIKLICQEIEGKMAEITQLKIKIKQWNNQKDCPQCSKIIPLETKHCPECGYMFGFANNTTTVSEAAVTITSEMPKIE